MPNAKTLKQEHIDALKYLVKYYEINKTGCPTIELMKGKPLMMTLKRFGLAFKTAKGWFPSTKGQEYVR